VKYGLFRALLWILAFLAVAVAPMLLAYVGPVPARSFWIEAGVGLGFVGLGVLLLQFVLTGRYRQVARSFGLDSMLQFHRQVGLVAAAFILAHPAILFLTDPGYLEFLDPRVNLMRALSLAGVTGAVLLLVATSLWRLTFRLSYEWWRALHGLLATFVIFIGVVHAIQVGYYVSELWKQAFLVALGAGGLALVANTRLVRPWRMRRRPYRVLEVREERGDASTLALAPEGHEGIRFRPGQFVWITLGSTPFSMQQHPYSLSSSAEAAPDRLELTVKEEGDFSTRARRAEPGATAFLEGPYGYFLPEPEPDVGCVMVVGGVGVTPCMSMLRTFADRGDPRELHLIYANVSLGEVIFHDALEELKERLDLTIAHVLEEPPEGWEGETGLIGLELLERHLPEDRGRYEYFICGPEPMMNIAERSLLELGIAQKRILSERFDMV
jgi:predicted ferric reductase